MDKDRQLEFSFYNKCTPILNHDTNKTVWKFGNEVGQLSKDWCSLLKLLSKHDKVNHKNEAYMISPTVHYDPSHPNADVISRGNKKWTRRCKSNAKEVSFIVLDFDDDNPSASIDNFKFNNNDFEYLIVTSFNHKIKEFGFRDKYRVFIPIEKSLSIPDYEAIRASLLGRFPYVDKTCFNVSQAFFMPSCAQSSIDDAYVYHNKSEKWFDPCELQIVETPQSTKESDCSKNSNNKAEKYDFNLKSFRILEFFKENGLYNHPLCGDKHSVTCPNHDQHTSHDVDSSTVIFDGNIPGFDCKHSHCQSTKSGLLWLIDLFGAQEISKYCDVKNNKKLCPDIPISKGFIKPDYDRIKNKLSESVNQIIDKHSPGDGNNSYLIYAAEGTTKSSSAVNFWKENKVVIFLTKSYKQAYEKLEYFEEMDVSPVLVKSKDARFSEVTDSKVVRKSSKHPFKAGEIDQNKTTNAAQKKSGKDIELLEFILNDSFYDDSIERRLYEREDFIIATFAQMRKLCNMDFELSENCVVFFDDPDLSDVIHISPYDSRTHRLPKNSSQESDLTIQSQPRDWVESISGRTYFARQKGMAPNQNKCIIIYTTTELCIKNYLKSIDVNIIDLMENVDAGKITLLGSKITHQTNDGVLPLILARLKKEGHNVKLIANGISSQLNNSNSKGLNYLVNTNIVAKISQPNLVAVETYIAALGLAKKNKFSVEWREYAMILMYDFLNQCIGRVAGYRYRPGSPYELIALIDPSYHPYFIEYTRYAIDVESNVLIDWTCDTTKSKLNNTSSKLIQQIDYYINSKEYPHSKTYTEDKKLVVDNLEDVDKKKFLSRLKKYENKTVNKSAGVSEFIDNMCISDGSIKLIDFEEILKKWQKENDRLQLKKSELRNELCRLGFEPNNKNRNKVYYIRGLSINN